MRAVTGTVTSSKPISLSKASAILSRFAAADIGARRDVAAYLKRASAAFEDLVQVHRELRSSRKRAERGVEESEGETSGRKKKEKGGDPNPSENLQAEVKLEKVLAEEEEADERRNKRKKKKMKEREDGSSKIHENGNVSEGEGNIEERRDLEKNYAELNGKVKAEVEEEEGYRSAERKKKEKEKEKKRDREVVENGGGEAEEGIERREKKRRRKKIGIEE